MRLGRTFKRKDVDMNNAVGQIEIKQAQGQESDHELLKLKNFSAKSAEVFYRGKPTWMTKKDWLTHPSNPYRIKGGQAELLNLVDEVRHYSGKDTFFRQKYLGGRHSVTEESIRLWVNKLVCLGAMTVKKIYHYKWINSYTVTEEFTKYKCAADRILGACKLEDHSECERPEVDYKCGHCHRYMTGETLEQQHLKQIDVLKSSYEIEISKKDQEIAELSSQLKNKQAYKEKRAKERGEKRVSKGKAREEFISKLKEEEKAIVYAYEEMAGREFDPSKDLRAFNELIKAGVVVSIIGILQTAINQIELAKEEGKELENVDLNVIARKAAIYSLKYCVGQVEKVSREFRQVSKEYPEMNINKQMMGYLGSTIATLDIQSALEVMGIIKAVPAKTLGGREAVQQMLGIYASKMTRRQVKAGLIDQEDSQEVTQQFLESLKLEFGLAGVQSWVKPHKRHKSCTEMIVKC